ncbi:MAG: hypothetical protein MRECE_45c006 [Mycoplasmataceae bacterium CE_OT135]|nr:MAG: hypothetical protein MRECE_45c006 [Mycoplasmataceae bacterium CE_OT135]
MVEVLRVFIRYGFALLFLYVFMSLVKKIVVIIILVGILSLCC